MARWCQEDFLKYMREHYGLDRLVEYGTTPLPDTTQVVNPAWRQAVHAVRRQRATVTRRAAAFGAASLSAAPEAPELERFTREKGQLQADLIAAQAQLATPQAARTAQAKHVGLQTLPAEQRFAQLRPEKNTSSLPSNCSPTAPRPPWPELSEKNSPAPTTRAPCCATST